MNTPRKSPLHRAAELEFLVGLVARMDTPTDKIDARLKAGKLSAEKAEELSDDIMADLDDERLCSDASALYAVIRKARELMGIVI